MKGIKTIIAATLIGAARWVVRLRRRRMEQGWRSVPGCWASGWGRRSHPITLTIMRLRRRPPPPAPVAYYAPPPPPVGYYAPPPPPPAYGYVEQCRVGWHWSRYWGQYVQHRRCY